MNLAREGASNRTLLSGWLLLQGAVEAMVHGNTGSGGRYPNHPPAGVKAKPEAPHGRIGGMLYAPSRWLCLAGLGLALTACMPKLSDAYLQQDPANVFNPDFIVDQSLMQQDEVHPTADWGLSLLWQGDHYMITADQNVTPGLLTQRWRIRAVQDIPLLRAGQIIALGTCQDAGQPVSRVTAILRYDASKQWLDVVVGAWSYDFKQSAFVEYPAAQLRCLNPRYGLGLDGAPAAHTAAAPASTTHH